MTQAQNIVGPQVRKARYARDLTQDALAAKCNLIGWDLSRGTLAKIESGVRCVTDVELFVLAKALRIEMSELFPRDERAIVAMVSK